MQKEHSRIDDRKAFAKRGIAIGDCVERLPLENNYPLQTQRRITSLLTRYSHQTWYKKLKTEVDKQSKKLEKQRDATDITVDRTAKKRLEKQEERLKNINRELSMVKMKSMFAVGIIFTSLFSMFNNIFDGRVVTKLPFVPISWLRGLSHRNLPGNDYTDASFIFIYMLCTMSIRQ
ncbi:unnamed protein product, partial [Echinostoma caproni]|uniref:Calcium load-activated calcium channel n=1 Tax=Echinostoma caproni TaxID=27848 RepID=A0A183BBH1_9TREM